MIPASTPRFARVPGALRRLGRDRSRLVAVVALAIVTLSASGIQSTAASILQHTLNENWRGAYDILVTAKNNPASRNGLLSPNSLAAGDKGMSLADVRRVRTVAGIEVAAPIGEVEASQLHYGFPLLAVPSGTAGAEQTPQAFEVTTRLTTDDGLSKRLVATETNKIVIDETPLPPIGDTCQFFGRDIPVNQYPHLCGEVARNSRSTAMVFNGSEARYGGSLTDGVIRVPTIVSPLGATRITLVDPAAERALLGKAGDFLRPLEAVHAAATTSTAAMERWAEVEGGSFADQFVAQQAELKSQLTSGFFTNPDAEKEFDAFATEYKIDLGSNDLPSQNFIPLLATTTGAAPLTLTTSVSALGSAPRLGSNTESFVIPQGAGTPLGTSTADASALVNPFLRNAVEVPWPGTSPKPMTTNPLFDSLALQWAGTVAGSSATHPDTVTARGFARPIMRPNEATGDPFTTRKVGTDVGLESVYSPVTLIGTPNFTKQNTVVPVGSFSTTDLADLQASASYVPLGAYQSAKTTTVRHGKRVELQPSVSGLGLVSPRTIAIAPLVSAESWGQKLPVSAVRVRVSGLTGYTANGRQKVTEVATAIRRLGFTATLVAGSSPTPVELTVKNYAFGTTDVAGKQRVGTLHGVRQSWSELGAAARADTAVSTASVAVLGIALGAVALLLGAVQFASIPRRRSDATVMREIGWTRRRVRGWMWAEEVLGVVVLLLAAVATVAVSGLAVLPLAVAAASVTVIVATSAAAVLLGARGMSGASVRRTAPAFASRPDRLARGRRGGQRYDVTSPLRFGLRQARSNMFVSITQGAAVVIVGLAGAGCADLLVRASRGAGASILAQLATGQAAASQLVLSIIAIVAGVVLTIVVRRIGMSQRVAHTAALRSMGWTTRELRSARRGELAVILIPALLIAGELASIGATVTGSPDRTVIVATAVLAAALAAVLVLPVRLVSSLRPALAVILGASRKGPRS